LRETLRSDFSPSDPSACAINLGGTMRKHG
jgi:hypothetical protein